MKIINLLFQKYLFSLLTCITSSMTVFFIFSLIGNLNEEFSFLTILSISFLNSLQILTYVPAFIYLISIILFVILLRSKNEIIIIKSYFNLKRLSLFILPIVIFFTFLEVNKKNLSTFIEDAKSNIVSPNNQPKLKIFINKDDKFKNYIIFKNINESDLTNVEYRSYLLSDEKIQLAEFSNKLIFLNNSFFAKEFTRYSNNLIKNINTKKVLEINFLDVIKQKTIVKNISKNKDFKFNIKILNYILFYFLFFPYIFLYFFSSKFANTKQSLKEPIFFCLITLIYSFFVFNNSLSFYRQEFEIMASIIVGMFFLKIYLNE